MDETPASLAYAAEEHSFTTFDTTVDAIVRAIQPASVLDVGAGAGKYGRRIAAIVPGAHLTAIEMNADDIREHRLAEVYHTILQHDAAAMMVKASGFATDVAILGDVIEHLPKSAGLDFLNWLHYRAAYIVIITPEHMSMAGEPWFLGHNSLWSKRDFDWHDYWAFDQLSQMQLFVLRGNRPSTVTLADLVVQINAANIPIAFDKYYRNVALQLQHRMNTIDIDGTSWVWRPQ